MKLAASVGFFVLGVGCSSSEGTRLGTTGADNGGQPEPLGTAAPDGSGECEVGTRRDAAAGEDGSHCVCSEFKVWHCFGVSPERQIGGRADCNTTLAFGQESPCERTFSDCSDGRTYATKCYDEGDESVCLCIVNATPVGQLEPGIGCVASLEEANRLCSWSLTARTNASPQ